MKLNRYRRRRWHDSRAMQLAEDLVPALLAFLGVVGWGLLWWWFGR